MSLTRFSCSPVLNKQKISEQGAHRKWTKQTSRTYRTLLADVPIRVNDILSPRRTRLALLQIGCSHFLLRLQLRPWRTARERVTVISRRERLPCPVSSDPVTALRGAVQRLPLQRARSVLAYCTDRASLALRNINEIHLHPVKI